MRSEALATGGGPRPASVSDVLEVILDRGLVIDAYVRVSLVGIELLTVDARIVVASIDTYLHFARLANRLELGGGDSGARRGLADTLGRIQEEAARSRTRGVLRGAGEQVKDVLTGQGGGPSAPGRVVQRAAQAMRDVFTGDDQEPEDRSREAPESPPRDEAPAAPREEPEPTASTEARHRQPNAGFPNLTSQAQREERAPTGQRNEPAQSPTSGQVHPTRTVEREVPAGRRSLRRGPDRGAP